MSCTASDEINITIVNVLSNCRIPGHFHYYSEVIAGNTQFSQFHQL